ncbi:MAG: DNA replication/repair protein RecF [Armatimonadetes bacterium]|nr:DNA replication/repair protein RecF [Armatimonadota bacterium]
MLRLRRLWLRSFRNYERAEVVFDEGISAFVGANGQGKSNLLEAVYLVATGRSHRTAQEMEAIRFAETSARVRALVSRRGRDEELEVTLSANEGQSTTQMRVNGVPTTRGDILGRLPVVLAAPWDLEGVRGPASGRRRLMDGALAQLSPAYYFALHRYYRVISQRNAALRTRPQANLEPWDAQMVALGVRLTAARADYMQRLGAEAQGWFSRLGGTGTLRACYRPAWHGQEEEDIAGEARAQIARLRADEFRRGVTLSGPHRDEVDLLLDEGLLRAGGSQGQWRTAMLALRLAERAVMARELGGSPVLLLDDALGELDGERQRRVLQVDREGQILLTATALPEGEAEARVRVFSVRAGTVAEGEWSRRFEPS